MSNSFGKYFEWIGGLGSKYRPFLIYQLTAFNQKSVMMNLCCTNV